MKNLKLKAARAGKDLSQDQLAQLCITSDIYGFSRCRSTSLRTCDTDHAEPPLFGIQIHILFSGRSPIESGHRTLDRPLFLPGIDLSPRCILRYHGCAVLFVLISTALRSSTRWSIFFMQFLLIASVLLLGLQAAA